MFDVPSATIITRHSVECQHKDDPQYKRCNCRRSLRYMWHGKMRWLSTKQRTWAGAERFKRDWEASFDPGNAATTSTNTVRDTIDAFLTEKRGQNLVQSVVRAHERELDALEKFLALKQRHTIRQVTLMDLSEFRQTWQSYASRTRASMQTRLRSFFKYCLHADLVSKNTASGLSPITVDAAPTLPLTRAQYDNLLATIPSVYPDKPTLQQRMHAFVQCMRYSGLAIQDTTVLRRDQLRKDEQGVDVILTARTKTGQDVYVPIPPIIADELRATPNERREYFFWQWKGKASSASVYWSQLLHPVFVDAGLETGHSHQLRDTFACEMLTAGVPIEMVSKMLGHSSIKTTEKHYAAWVKARQVHLTSVVVNTWQRAAEQQSD